MSERCDYCYMYENGDVPWDRKNVIQYKAGHLLGKDIWLVGMICNNKLSITHLEGDSKEIPIKYCPMCGRKL